jgi:putative Holliday junction resolvase
VVAFDPGTARVGVAVCDAGRTMAFPREPVPAGPDTVARCAAIVDDTQASLVVVGLPLHLNGAEGDAATAARALADGLRGALHGVEVVLHDERLTTRTASERLRDAGSTARSSKTRIDGAAAVVLLESWLAT